MANEQTTSHPNPPRAVIDFREILAPDCTCVSAETRSKKAVLERASEMLSAHYPEIDARRLLQGLLTRERLGSTGLGEGVAIPHCRDEQCQAPAACLLRTHPIDFDAPDDRAVDLVFVLAVPSHGQRVHLEILGALARAFDDPGNLAMLRSAETASEMFEALQRQLDLAQRE